MQVRRRNQAQAQGGLQRGVMAETRDEERLCIAQLSVRLGNARPQ